MSTLLEKIDDYLTKYWETTNWGHSPGLWPGRHLNIPGKYKLDMNKVRAWKGFTDSTVNGKRPSQWMLDIIMKNKDKIFHDPKQSHIIFPFSVLGYDYDEENRTHLASVYPYNGNKNDVIGIPIDALTEIK